MIVLLDGHFFFVKVNENLEGVIVFAGIPYLNKLRRNLDDDFRILMAVLVVAAEEMFFIQLFKLPVRSVC